MGKKLVWKYIGKVLIGFSFIFIFPIIVALIYKERILSFLISLGISLVLGTLLNSIKTNDKCIYTKDGFIIVALAWIIISLIGALPFYLNGFCSYIDALFEIISGFTTTGATIFQDVEVLSKSILFWRSFSHFIGGMGILTLVMAVIPLSKRDNSMHVLKAEMPGPSITKLVPNTKKTLVYLYSIYIGLTVGEIVLLLFGKLDLFNSIIIAMGTAGTGGFSTLNTSLATISLFDKYVVAIFMFLFGVNFNIYFLLIMKDFKSIFKSEELKIYIVLFLFSVGFIFFNTYQLYQSISSSFINSFFHVSSIMTSTGFSISDVNIYPTSCRILLLMLMLISACAGSTCGGFKISRLLIITKIIKRDIQRIFFPARIKTITYEGKKVDAEVINSTCSFMFLYFMILFGLIFIISLNGFSLSETINAVFTTFGNVGLCFDINNFSVFSNFSKIILSIGMLLGRLEIFPLIVLFSKNYN